MKEPLQRAVRRLALAGLAGDGILKVVCLATLADLVRAEVVTQEEVEIEGNAAFADAANVPVILGKDGRPSPLRIVPRVAPVTLVPEEGVRMDGVEMMPLTTDKEKE